MSNTVPLSGKATVDALADQWGKLLAIHMYKEKIFEIVLSTQDIQNVIDDQDEPTLCVQELKDGLHIKLLSIKDVIELVK